MFMARPGRIRCMDWSKCCTHPWWVNVDIGCKYWYFIGIFTCFNCNVIPPPSSHRVLWAPQPNVIFQRGRAKILLLKYIVPFLKMHQIKKRNKPLYKYQRGNLNTHRQTLQMKQKTYLWHAVSRYIDLFLCSEEQETPFCLLDIFSHFCCLAVKGKEYLLRAMPWDKECKNKQGFQDFSEQC